MILKALTQIEKVTDATRINNRILLYFFYTVYGCYILFMLAHCIDCIEPGFKSWLVCLIPLLLMGYLGVWIFILLLNGTLDEYEDCSTIPGAIFRASLHFALYMQLVAITFHPSSTWGDAWMGALLIFCFHVGISLTREITYEPLYINNSVCPAGKIKIFELSTFTLFSHCLSYMLRSRSHPESFPHISLDNEENYTEYAKENTAEETLRYKKMIKRCVIGEWDFIHNNKSIFRIIKHIFCFSLPYLILIGTIITLHIWYPLSWDKYAYYLTHIPFSH